MEKYNRQYDIKYRKSARGQTLLRRWRNSTRGKRLERERQMTPHYKKLVDRYQKTAIGKEVLRRAARKFRLKKYYNLTFKEVNKMIREQHGRCYICKKPENKKRNGRTQKLSVDHNHQTNRVRHLLCDSCNKVVGYIENGRAPAKFYIKYIRENRK